MRDFIREALGIVQQQTDAKLRAYVIMSNHLHVLLQQGHRPLAAFMQPLLCRIALAVKRKYRIDGHIFGRTYWDSPCDDQLYARAIVEYIHANPVRANLCSTPADWSWSSYTCYAHPALQHFPLVEPIFDVALSSPVPLVAFAGSFERRQAWLDLRDLLELYLRQLTDDGMTLFELRARRGREATRIRRALIKRAGEAGYRGCAIAHALAVSETTVSKVVRAANLARPRLIAG